MTYRCLSRALVMTLLSTAPTICSFTWPSLMTSSVGIPRILKRAAVEPFASTSSLPTLTRPLYSTAMESMVGASARHGAHHAAQKSTSTGVVDFTTSDSKLESVISTVFSPMNPPKNFTVAGRNRKSQIGDTERESATKRQKKHKRSTKAKHCVNFVPFCGYSLSSGNDVDLRHLILLQMAVRCIQRRRRSDLLSFSRRLPSLRLFAILVTCGFDGSGQVVYGKNVHNGSPNCLIGVKYSRL